MQTIKRLTPFLSVAAQLQPTDMALPVSYTHLTLPTTPYV